MPEETPELGEPEAAELVRKIEAGEDGIVVPAELLEEPEERVTRASTRSCSA